MTDATTSLERARPAPRIRRSAWLALSMVCALGCVSPAEQAPKVIEGGLVEVEHSEVARAYLAPNADLAQYDSVMLLECYVAFAKHWRDSDMQIESQVSHADMQKIKTALSEEFAKVFTKELEAGGYKVVSDRDAGVLLVRPAIINLEITAPDSMEEMDETTYSASAGSMELYAEFYDASTSALIGKVADRRAASLGGQFMWQNGVTNKASADQLLRHWARLLVERLDAARKAEKPKPA